MQCNMIMRVPPLQRGLLALITFFVLISKHDKYLSKYENTKVNSIVSTKDMKKAIKLTRSNVTMSADIDSLIG